MLARRLQHWPSIKPKVGQRVVYAGWVGLIIVPTAVILITENN